MNRLALSLLVGAALVAQIHAQDSAHWGIQADSGYFFVPKFIVEKIETLPEIPSIEGVGFQAGVVRFNDRGAPSYAIQFSQIRVGIEGSIADSRGRAGVSGAAAMRGVMVTKYLNFFTADRASAGLALGGGAGKLEAWYTVRKHSHRGDFLGKAELRLHYPDVRDPRASRFPRDSQAERRSLLRNPKRDARRGRGRTDSSFSIR